eukprot:jgi/Tetstr1/432763/TSEL_002325.t1
MADGSKAAAVGSVAASATARDPIETARRSIEALYYGTDEWSAKVLDMLTTSLTASTYSNYEGTIRLFGAEFCIDEEGISPLDCTESTCVSYLTWIAE